MSNLLGLHSIFQIYLVIHLEIEYEPVMRPFFVTRSVTLGRTAAFKDAVVEFISETAFGFGIRSQ